MIRGLFGTILIALIASAVGVGLFFVKHEVKEQEARLAELNREIQTNQEAIHVLKAEWSYLNDPSRLKKLSEKYLEMKVMAPGQVTTLQALAPQAVPAGTGLAQARPPSPRPQQQPALAESKPPPGGLR